MRVLPPTPWALGVSCTRVGPPCVHPQPGPPLPPSKGGPEATTQLVKRTFIPTLNRTGLLLPVPELGAGLSCGRGLGPLWPPSP